MTTEEGNHGVKGTDALEALERFVVENDDLLALESLIGRFNIFDALGIAGRDPSLQLSRLHPRSS